MQKLKNILMGLVMMALVFSCSQSPRSPAEKVSRDFVEAYYVKADLKQALTLSDGLAQEKVQSSLMLREGQMIDPSSHQPNISFKRVESKLGNEEAEFIYDLQIKPSQMEPIRKKTRIKVRERDGAWKVTQFTDYNL